MKFYLKVFGISIILTAVTVIGGAYCFFSSYLDSLNHIETSQFKQEIYIGQTNGLLGEYFTYRINFETGREYITYRPKFFSNQEIEMEYDGSSDSVYEIFHNDSRVLLRLQDNGLISFNQGTENVPNQNPEDFARQLASARAVRDHCYLKFSSLIERSRQEYFIFKARELIVSDQKTKGSLIASGQEIAPPPPIVKETNQL